MNLLASAVNGKVNKAVGVSTFVIIPGDDLVEVVVKVNAGGGVDDRAVLGADQIGGDQGLSAESHDSLEITFGGLLEGSVDFITSACLFGANSQVHQRNIGNRHTNSHTGKLALQLRDDLGNCLGSSGGGRDAVVQGATSSSPILSSLGRTIDNQLVGSGGVDGGHETLDNSELVVDDLGERSKAVGGARSVGNDTGTVIRGVVDTHDVHRSIRRRS